MEKKVKEAEEASQIAYTTIGQQRVSDADLEQQFVRLEADSGIGDEFAEIK